ncbi:hypothetical protein AB4Z29_10475 [Paenibacillus sp. 2TAB23]|uniref:hypothetical protein n=1 Tax=Paenibacillus sp. 2TAB23 TaxID=3233004 RepID=UPI003F9B180C
MDKKLLIVINETNQNFKFVNKECDNDERQIQPYASSSLASINLTPGQYGAGCDIPDCSASKYFDAHHMALINPNNNPDETPAFCFWYDDDQNQYYYTITGVYNTDPKEGDTNKVIPGNVSSSETRKAIYIKNDGTLLITDIYNKQK